jgi:hypothetical protein
MTFIFSDQLSGNSVSPLAPFPSGPRHCGQFSAWRMLGISKISGTRVVLRVQGILIFFDL